MSISFGGVGEGFVTFKSNANVTKGSAVKMSANDTVSLCSDGDKLIGIATDVSGDGYCTVQLFGYVTAKYTGTAPSVGFATLAANSAGGVKSASTGREYAVLNVNSADKTVGFIL